MKQVDEKIYENEGNPDVIESVPEEASTILDVGCGAGNNASILADKGCQVDGITLSEKEAESASRYCRQVYLHDLEEGLPQEVVSDTYDCVICSHVIEHLRDPDPLLQDTKEALEKSGRLVVALPNIVFYKNRFKLLFGKFEYESGGLMDNTHYKWYTYKSSQHLLEGHGYEKVSAYATGSFPIPGLRRVVPRGTFALIDRAASFLFPGFFGYQIMLVYSN